MQTVSCSRSLSHQWHTDSFLYIIFLLLYLSSTPYFYLFCQLDWCWVPHLILLLFNTILPTCLLPPKKSSSFLGVIRAFTQILNLINAAEVYHRLRLLRNADIISGQVWTYFINFTRFNCATYFLFLHFFLLSFFNHLSFFSPAICPISFHHSPYLTVAPFLWRLLDTISLTIILSWDYFMLIYFLAGWLANFFHYKVIQLIIEPHQTSSLPFFLRFPLFLLLLIFFFTSFHLVISIFLLPSPVFFFIFASLLLPLFLLYSSLLFSSPLPFPVLSSLVPFPLYQPLRFHLFLWEKILSRARSRRFSRK